jgi:hypothetical protein
MGTAGLEQDKPGMLQLFFVVPCIAVICLFMLLQ